MISKKTKKFTGVAALAIGLAFTVTGSFAGTAYANIGSTLDTGKKYETQYDSINESLQASSDLNLEIAAEGFILLKNNSALPLAKNERSVTVVGQHAVRPLCGGGGSGEQVRPCDNVNGTPTSIIAEKQSNIFDGLEKAGIKYNPRSKAIYEKNGPATFVDANGQTYYEETGHYMEKVDAAGTDTVDFDGNHYKNLASGGTLSPLNNNLSA